MRRSGAGFLAVCVGSAIASGPAGAQQAQNAPACDSRPPTLEWQLRNDGRKRSVNLRFNKYVTTGAALKPVQVQIARPSATRAFQWSHLNHDHYSYRNVATRVTPPYFGQGKGQPATLTARYIENRSGYQRLGSPDQVLGLVPVLPGLITLPGLPALDDMTLPIPLIPLITGPLGGGGGDFRSEYCVRTITRIVR